MTDVSLDPGEVALPAWIAQQAQTVLRQRGHAWLLQGPSGLGQYSLALSLARAWLCENGTVVNGCGHCGSCHAIYVRAHADLCVLMPETHLIQRNWPLGEKAQAEIDEKKRKPSKEIRVDALREAIEFSQRTSARGRGKVVLVFPAEQMNAIAANALLKTLEEPPGDVKFLLATESAQALLPTIRSRCLIHTMLWPAAQDAMQWLVGQGVSDDQVQDLLQAGGGRPEAAMHMVQSGIDAAAWQHFPQWIRDGNTQLLRDWSMAQVVDALEKLVHDMTALHLGASPRFFPAGVLQSLKIQPPLSHLLDWSRMLKQTHTTVEHPLNSGLMLEALVAQAQSALHSVNQSAHGSLF